MFDGLSSGAKSQVTFIPLFGETVAAFRHSITNRTWPKHFHDHFVIATTLDGVGQFNTDHGRFVARAGDLIIFNPGQVHDGGTGDSGTWNYLSLQVTTRALENLFYSTFDKKAPEIIFPLSFASDEEISRLLKNLHALPVKALDQTVLETQFIRLAHALFSRYLDVKGDSVATRLTISTLARAADYIQAHYTENISIRELAAVTGLHENYFINAFRKRYGAPPHAYLNQVRVHSAAREIRRGAPVIEAATQAGFYDQSHFHRYFRRMYGVTPGQYMAAARRCPAPDETNESAT